MAKEYWVCVYGPVERDSLPAGSDFPPRMAVRNAMNSMIPGGEGEALCASGWGCDEQTMEAIRMAWSRTTKNQEK